MVQIAAEIGGLTTALCDAFACGAQRRAASSAPELRTTHEGELFRDMIADPLTLPQTLHRNLFHLSDCIKMELQVNALPPVFAQCNDILNRAALFLPARIREGLCNRPLGKIKRIGETKRDKIAGKTPIPLGAFGYQPLHVAWDIDRMSDRFHKCLCMLLERKFERDFA